METDEKEDVSQKVVKQEAEEEESAGHTCGVCGRSFPLLSSLSQHMRRHTREKPYKCPYCEHRTAQKGSLKAHVRSHKLGLLGHKLEADGDQEQRDSGETSDSPENVKPPDKAHAVNGKVKRKSTKKKSKDADGWLAEGGGGDNEADDDGGDSCTCAICGQTFPQVQLLKTHIKRHRSGQDHGCRICGRRFRQAWFLQSHMRIHRVKAAQLRGGKSAEPPVTINEVQQDPAALFNDQCLYELCASCGNFFTDRKALRAHEKLHRPHDQHGPTHGGPRGDASDAGAAKRRFMAGLNLSCAESRETPEEQRPRGRILELDPICSYQAWQLATRGRLAEATEKCLGWEERLADAEVAYDTEKGEYVPLKQERKRKQIDAPGSGGKKMKSEAGLEPTSKSKGGGEKKSSQKDRILLNGLGHAFYEALQSKRVKDAQSSSSSSSSRSKNQEGKKPYSCHHCDFHTADASLLRTHLHKQHQDFLGLYGKQGGVLDEGHQNGPKASRYMDYLRSRSALLSQPCWNPYTSLPGYASAEASLVANGGEVKGQGSTGDAGSLLNLSSLDAGGAASRSDSTEGLVRHQCPYCGHASSYPEVLWIHQRVAHKVDGGSSVAPKWAPSASIPKSLKGGGAQWRRTGPPPFLEGKDCPTLHTPRTLRTQPPGGTSSTSSTTSTNSTTSTTSSSSKHSAPKAQPAPSKPRHQSKDSRSSSSSEGKTGGLPQKKSGEKKQSEESGGKSCGSQAAASSSSSGTKNPAGLQPSSSPKYHRPAAVEANFPQEGLGFMLGRSRGGTSSGAAAAAADRAHFRRQSCDSSSGADLWAAMNMWGHKAYLEHLHFAQGKTGTSGEMPMDIDILGLLKNYNPHDLAALYQHWGFVDPRIDPQALLQLNGGFGKELHPTSEAAKQVNSRPTSSSGSLHKGT